MTREEAIEILQELWRYKETDKYTEAEIRQALNMAIKALEQEPIYYPPCQDCHTKMNEIRRAYDNVKSLDDAVSRQALLEFFKDDDYVVNEINNMPSVLPKRNIVNCENFKFDEWDIEDKKAELWVVKGRLQIRHRGTIHNVDFPVLPKREQGEWTRVEDGLPKTHKYNGVVYKKRSDEVMCKIKADEDVINSCGYLMEHADGHKKWQTDCYMSDDDEVIAWMPIPKYEAESEDI